MIEKEKSLSKSHTKKSALIFLLFIEKGRGEDECEREERKVK